MCPIDLSTEPRDDDFSPIPPGIYKLQATTTPGDFGPGLVLKKSRKGTLAYLPVKNVVLGGEHSGRIIYSTINVELIPQRDSILGNIPPAEGDKTAVKIGRTHARRIVESARAVDPNADTETMREQLTIGGWDDLDGLIFWAHVEIEPASNGYRAKNVIDRVITPADRDWPGSPTEPAVPTRPLKIVRDYDMNDEIPF
jgi:hypothetical protein